MFGERLNFFEFLRVAFNTNTYIPTHHTYPPEQCISESWGLLDLSRVGLCCGVFIHRLLSAGLTKLTDAIAHQSAVMITTIIFDVDDCLYDVGTVSECCVHKTQLCAVFNQLALLQAKEFHNSCIRC